MAPEQIRGEHVDGRVDQFAWGVCAYELLTGRLPWKGTGEAVTVLASILVDEPPPLPATVPAGLATVVLRALRKAPGERFGDMDALVAALEAGTAAPAPRRPRKRVAALALAAAAAFGAAAAAAVITRPTAQPAPSASAPAARGRPAKMLEAPPPRSPSAEALAAYRGGLTAWHDGNALTIGYDELARASRLDPALGAAHVRAAFLGYKSQPAAARELLAKARQQRATLDEHDQALLEAIAPLHAEPSDYVAMDRRAEEGLARFPDDEELLFVRAFVRVVRYDAAELEAVADRLLALDPGFAEVLYMKAFARILVGDSAGAARTFERCLRDAPGSSSCRWNRMIFDEVEGRCEAVLADAKGWAAAEPTHALPLFWLAKAHAALGAYEAARAALARRRERLPEDERRSIGLRDDARLAVLEGRFAEAERLAREHLDAVAGSPLLMVHRDAALLHAQILEEQGRRDAAADVAEPIVAREGAWTSSPTYAPIRDTTIALSGVLERAGRIGHAQMVARRAEAAERGLAWFVRQGAPRDAWAGRVWTHVYAASRIDAQGPLVARALAIGGRWAEAREALDRSVGWCGALEAPVLAVRVRLAHGAAREQGGDRDGACAAYADVVARWGGAKKSVTADAARARAKALGCPARTPPR
jgi:serine/threonine-protein kinase